MNAVENTARAEALTSTLTTLDKRFGAGTCWRLGERDAQAIDTFPTGCLALDIALGVGGLPRGRVVEIYGPESSGKTTLALHAIASVQAKGGTAAFIDAEHALDPTYAGQLGVDLDSLVVSQPDCGEQALEVTEALVRSGAVDVVVVDSVAALVPQAELEGDMGDAHMGLQARLMSQALRKITAITGRTGATVIFINQVRQKIGVVFGNGEVTTGGNALKFYASMRLDIRRIGSIKNSEGEIIGNKTKVKVVKNKLAPPFRVVETEILYGKGFSLAGDVLELGHAMGLVNKSGSWYKLGEEGLGQGREKARDALNAAPELLDRLTAEIRGHHLPHERLMPVAEA